MKGNMELIDLETISSGLSINILIVGQQLLKIVFGMLKGVKNVRIMVIYNEYQ